MPKPKRLTKIIHPNSRRALELASKEYHKSKAIRAKEDSKQKSNNLSRKLAWFKNAITKDPSQSDETKMTVEENFEEDVDQFEEFKNKATFTIAEIHQIINLYFKRFDGEIEQIKVKNSIGKRTIGQNFSREKAIEITLESEKNEYQTSGISIPDLTNLENVKILRNWNGQISTIQTIKLKSIKKTN